MLSAWVRTIDKTGLPGNVQAKKRVEKERRL